MATVPFLQGPPFARNPPTPYSGLMSSNAWTGVVYTTTTEHSTPHNPPPHHPPTITPPPCTHLGLMSMLCMNRAW